MTTEAVRIGLLGFGTVGSNVYRLIEREREEIRQATGLDLEVAAILEKDPTLERPDVPSELFTAEYEDILGDPSIRIVIELIGGTDPAFDFVDGALRAGKDVVTANKQLLAKRGASLFDLAKEKGRQIRFEAAVAGAIPIIKVMRESMLAAELHTVYGIVNGTTNYILSEMYRGEGGYEQTLARAQELGYAEADPTEDVNGADAAAKMAIAASIAYHSRVALSDVTYTGIESITLDDVQYAREFGFAVKLIGAARLVDGRVNVRVHPALVPEGHPLASIGGPYNAVFLKGDAIDEIMLSGPGAGGVPTSSAVVGDVISILSTDRAGFLQSCSCYKERDFVPDDEMESAFFLRMRVEDRAGVLAQIASIFGEHNVSIRSMIQKGHDDQAELVLITHPTVERAFVEAMEGVAALPCCRSKPSTIRVLEDPAG